LCECGCECDYCTVSVLWSGLVCVSVGVSVIIVGCEQRQILKKKQ